MFANNDNLWHMLLHRLQLNDATLSTLPLYFNNIDFTQIKVLTKALQQNNQVRELDLNNNGLEDKALAELSQALINHPSLLALDLGYNEIGMTAY